MRETPCGCCEGIEKLTPLATADRPGLGALRYRIGTHAAFLETMLARLSNLCLGSEEACREGTGLYPLQNLKTRERSDPAVALLDAWATVADVLTFYQERIANEGYLRTATERRSILELAKLVGYELRPGVASSVFLAYTLDDNFKEEVIIPKGAKSQSVPGPGELPQSFETGEALKARARWNNLKPRLTQPQTAASIKNDPRPDVEPTVHGPRVYLKGINTNLKPNDPLLIDFGDSNPFHSRNPVFFRVTEVHADAAADRTLVTLRSDMHRRDPTTRTREERATQGEFIKALTLPPSVQPANSLRLEHKLKEQFTPKAETGYAAVSAFAPVLRETLPTAAANAEATPDSTIKVYALRVKAPLFGSNAPRKPDEFDERSRILLTKEWDIRDIVENEEIVTIEEERKAYSATVFLDTGYDQILPNSWIVVDTGAVDPNKTLYVEPAQHGILIAKAGRSQADLSRAAYGLSGKTTRIELADQEDVSKQKAWFVIQPDSGISAVARPAPDDFQIIRRTIVYAQSEEIELAEEPVGKPVCRGADDPIELDGFYEGLESGRWVIVSGEREIEGTSGVRFSEPAMLATVTQDTQKINAQASGGHEHGSQEQALPGDKTHTFIKLAENLRYCFKRDTVTIYGNVVKATHGETRKEVLGSGDGSVPFQTFALKQPPLTYVAAPTPAGAESTLKVWVNDVEWHETDALAGLSPTDRRFVTQTGDDAKTAILFGNGREGARLPTGIENIKAEYRNGIGKPGNVKAGQISLLSTRPLGVNEVVNPLRASGGADRESRDQARKNAPLAVTALDRLVSVRDYEDFARTFAGIGKARAAELSDGRRKLVHLTIAGADDIPVDETSDLFRNLRQALHDFGDPAQPFQVAVRELMLLVISARVRIRPDYRWEAVEPEVRAALLDGFGFERREPGQDAVLSEAIGIMQAVQGVAYVDVDVFGGVPEKKLDAGERRLLTPEEIAAEVQKLVDESPLRPNHRVSVNLADFEKENGTIRPAQIAFLSPDVPATLILNLIQ
ncbi:putative baseplate assembly protein [Methylocaldum sp. MU1018]